MAGWDGGQKLLHLLHHLSQSSPIQGQRPCDLADEEVLSLLEELARKQEDVSLRTRLPLLLTAPRGGDVLVS